MSAPSTCEKSSSSETESTKSKSETKATPSQPSNNTDLPERPDDNETWGYDLYPERKGDRVKTSWSGLLIWGEGRRDIEKIKCEKNCYYSIQKSPYVRLLLSALKSAGCEFDPRRHVSCEVCGDLVTGGYDPETNQVIVCQNAVQKKGNTQAVLTHELVHMYDWCRAKLDFTNLHHLACTEVRAANLAQCSFMSAVVDGVASPFNIKQTHQECVRNKAVYSVMAVRRGLTKREARAAVDAVFARCYADLEPIGRRCRRNSRDPERAYLERFKLGYDAEID
ncbi:PREDICTED: mitochondrial inner membrane protease ATP23 homolog [Priapulus caudatus]|uniref:Mitochondrial inner membrane protease ATP23 n=1 Tax=Priapulus caudatus TaxID=37621 RepID=A0ABM1ESD0_PRICU|nr:PREDICTED: mitochondrial inner membrane protease ATP23 homolog [Priapulus caudatus]